MAEQADFPIFVFQGSWSSLSEKLTTEELDEMRNAKPSSSLKHLDINPNDHIFIILEAPGTVKTIAKAWVLEHLPRVRKVFKTADNFGDGKFLFSLIKFQAKQGQGFNFSLKKEQVIVVLPLFDWSRESGCFVTESLKRGDAICLRSETEVWFPATTDMVCIVFRLMYLNTESSTETK